MSRQPTRPCDFDLRLRAVESFRKLPEAESLTAANKRIHNILRQAVDDIPKSMNNKLLREDAEQSLAECMSALSAEVHPLLDQGNYSEALKRLASLRSPVDTFFDKVMVMADEKEIRVNRLALLNNMHNLFLRVADLTRLQMHNQ
jgi:glycyl-tRNA synthetase beta chain